MSKNTMMQDQLIHNFVKNYIEKIFYFCLKKTSNHHDAEELTQDIALNVIDALNKGILPNNFSAWVWQIARNLYSKWAKEKSNNINKMNSIDISNLEMIDDQNNVIDDLIHEEQLTLLRRELAFIKSDYHNIIVSYYLENKSVRDIANSLSLSVDVIHQRLHRARETLKEGMNMTRTFGKRSYNPEDISFVMNGRSGAQGQPWSIITHLLYKNIFLEVYENPQTAESLALELGIALPYMEEELEFLTKEELLRKVDNKYETNFKIISREEQLSTHNRIVKYVGEITNKLCELIDCYIHNHGQKVDIQSIGYENAKWALLIHTFDKFVELANPPKFKEDLEYPIRPDQGSWTIIGYEDKIDFKKPEFVGQHGYNYQDKKEIIKNIYFGQYKFQIYDLYDNTPTFLVKLPLHNKLIQLIVE